MFQNQVKQKKKASQAITKGVVNSATGATAKQRKRKRVTDEAADRRTVFVGNLPVSCTDQVRGWVLSARGMKGVAAVLSLRRCLSWEVTHTCDWNSFWESRKWCLFSETIRDNLRFPGVGLPAAVDAVTLS